MPLGKFVSIERLIKEEGLTEIDRQVKIVAILADMTEDDVLIMPIQDYQDLALQTTFLSDVPDKSAPIKKEYKVGKFVLVPTTDIRKVTTAQYTDYQEYCKMDSAWVEIMSCLLVPKGKTYCKEYDPIEVQEAIRTDLMTTDAVALMAFFLTSCQESIVSIRTSLETMDKERRKEIRKANRRSRMHSRRNGGGRPMSTLFRRLADALGRRSTK